MHYEQGVVNICKSLWISLVLDPNFSSCHFLGQMSLFKFQYDHIMSSNTCSKAFFFFPISWNFLHFYLLRKNNMAHISSSLISGQIYSYKRRQLSTFLLFKITRNRNWTLSTNVVEKVRNYSNQEPVLNFPYLSMSKELVHIQK